MKRYGYLGYFLLGSLLIAGAMFIDPIIGAPSFGSSGTGSPPEGSIATIAQTVTSTFADLASLITGASYVAGFGFSAAAIVKFKAHKDNPTQIPIGTPIALLFVGAALIFLPYIFSAGGITLFGEGASSSTPTGTAYVAGEDS